MAAYANAPPPPYPGTNPPPMAVPVSKIELKVSCRNLVDMDVFSKSDPFVVVYMQSQGSTEWREIGRTETIWDNLNPDFVKSFIVDYFFEEQQAMKFEVYDMDDENSRSLTDQDYIGKLVTSVGSIVGENCGKLEHPLQTPTAKDKERAPSTKDSRRNDKFSRKCPGTIIVRAEEVSSNKDVVTLTLFGKKLDKKDFFGKSDPYLEFQRCNEDNSYSVVHRTEVIKSNLNPVWKPFTLPVQTLCNGDYDRTLKVYCYDWNSNGTADLIGLFEVTLGDLKGYKSGRPAFYELQKFDKHGKKSKKKAGTIHIQDCVIHTKYSFLDYISGGLVLNFVVAIDFTASNGEPTHPDSLHYTAGHSPSQYVQVLKAIGGIIEDYDSDKLFPTFGFGARLPPSWTVSHEFALNFNPSDPNCLGLEGIIQAYYHSINNVQLYGPTNFSPVMNSCTRIAKSSDPRTQYYVLLIITDGIITDMNKTKQAIIDAAGLPISIIIVGVGGADFAAMEELDGDDVRVNLNGQVAERDIVQFVPFRDYMQGGVYNPAYGVRLAKDVLHELPDQVIEFMEKRKIQPNVRAPPT